MVFGAWVVAFGGSQAGAEAASISSAVATPTFDSTSGGAISGMVLTSDGTDKYLLKRTPTGELITSAPTNKSSNLREALVPVDPAPTANGESCATWTSQTGQNTQLGAAFRVRSSASGRVRAVTITQNVWFGARWIFNVHVWDTAQSPPMTPVGSVNFGQKPSVVPKVPLRFCARVIDDQASFKLWATSESEPAWGDPSRSGSVPLPVAGRGSGRTGWYVGHLGVGDRASYDFMTTGSFATVRPAWHPFDSATGFVARQHLDLTGSPSSKAEVAAQAATITDPLAAARFIDDRLDGPWAGGVVGPIYRIYQAFFRRPPDQSGIVHWSNQMRSGVRLTSIASSFARSNEFKRTYGPLSNAQYVDRIYRNVLGRPADRTGAAYWMRRLEGGASRGSVMASFSESSENKRKTAPAAAVTTMNLTLLGRATPAADLMNATQRLTEGATLADLIAEILGDGDYAVRVDADPTHADPEHGSGALEPGQAEEPQRFVPG